MVNRVDLRELVQALIDQFGDKVLSPEHAHALDEAPVVDVPDTVRLDVPIVDRGGVEDKRAAHCEELEEAADDGMFPSPRGRRCGSSSSRASWPRRGAARAT